MTSRKEFIKNGILLSAVGILSRTVSLFFGAFVTRTVGTVGMGMYTLLMTVFGFAVTFATSGVSLTVTRLCADAIGEGDYAKVSSVFHTCLRFAAAFSLVTTFLMLCFSKPLSKIALGNVSGAPALCVLALSLCPIALSSVFSGYFVALRHISKNALTQILTQASKIVITLLFLPKVAKLGAAASCLFLSTVCTATDVVCLLLLFALYQTEKRRKEGARTHEFSSVLGMALPLAVSAYIRQALITLEHILIPKRLRLHGSSPEESLSQYGVLQGMAIPMLLYPMAPLTSFSGLLVPEFAECQSSGQKQRMSKIASLAVSYTLVFGIAVGVFLLLFSEELGYKIYRSYEAGRLICALCPVVPVMYLDHVTDAMLKGIGEQVYSMWVNITDAALSVVLVIALLPKFGIMGYVGAILGMETYNFLLSYFRLKKRIPFKINLHFAVISPLLSAILSSTLSLRLFVMRGDEVSALWLILKLTFAVCLFVFFFLLSNQIATHLTKKKEILPKLPPS